MASIKSVARPKKIPCAKQALPSCSEDSSDLAKALKENKEATRAVEKAADDLAVVHAVLDSELPKGAISSDVDQAVEQTKVLEKQLSASTKKLKKVNDSLEQEFAKGNP